jgi:hypothetical protein
MIQIFIALLITLGHLASAEQWDRLSSSQQETLIIGVDVFVE